MSVLYRSVVVVVVVVFKSLRLAKHSLIHPSVISINHSTVCRFITCRQLGLAAYYFARGQRSVGTSDFLAPLVGRVDVFPIWIAVRVLRVPEVWTARHWRVKSVKELFNDALNTFYLRLYGVEHMVEDHSDSERGNPLPPHGLLFPIKREKCFI